jgi:hypothetical protein
MITPQRIINTKLPAAVGVLYTATEKKILKKITCTNGSGGTLSVTLYLVPSAGSPGTGNICGPSAKGLLAGECREWYELENHVMEVGDTIQGFDGANAVAIQGSAVAWT